MLLMHFAALWRWHFLVLALLALLVPITANALIIFAFIELGSARRRKNRKITIHLLFLAVSDIAVLFVYFVVIVLNVSV